MQSIIFKTIDQNNDDGVSIWSMWYLNKSRKGCKQLVCILQRNHTEEDREYLMSLTQEELLYALEYAINKNPLHVLYPN